MKAAQIILEAKDLSIGYTARKVAVTVASNINFCLNKGSLTALIGANGIGKSTLLKNLTGLEKPLAGEVLLDGRSIKNYTAAQLSEKLSIVLTESLPPSNLTVYELVALGRQPYTNRMGNLSQEDHAKIENALALTETLHLSEKKHFEISDGQLQKVLIARALAQDTPLIILDEPTTHLDFQHKVNLLQLLKKLTTDEGKCILYSTHDLDLALQMSDELMVMKPGIVQTGTPQQLIESNVFDDLFTDGNIGFDAVNKRFFVR
ncbi:ATP-binding cassette domain-containing protein [Flavobacterium sp. Sd200]|uniref:ABC transporter ATP-binding protein n=1 Tax=Flavobacterium sp. Sd200 TaxID=2692211 RepID=UPI00136D6817|nr:ABC transporter ATP-binding protein [Flavobacterium sp. Sd200]MXN91917.1 ATP-binding cassette domain-containing protein [Flavobacterium sp. Sd200]